MRRPKPVQRVAVLGCGFIGFSWAIVFLRNGISVHAFDTSAGSREAMPGRVRKGLEFLRDEGVIDEATVDDSLGRLTVGDDLAQAVEGAQYVQEALPEDLPLKQATIARVADLVAPEVVIGSSASGLLRGDIVRAVTRNPERFIIAHPTNPPHLIPFMEIAGDAASDEAKDWAVEFMTGLGQKPVKCRERYGYVLNRLQLALVQEALFLVRDGVCSVEAVESAITEGLGLRWAFTGPYGVEELNSADLGEGLRKYRTYMLECFRDLGEVEAYDDEFVAGVVEAFKPVMRGLSHDDYLLWRDQMVTRTRALKERLPAT